jgi:hypothetical protein
VQGSAKRIAGGRMYIGAPLSTGVPALWDGCSPDLLVLRIISGPRRSNTLVSATKLGMENAAQRRRTGIEEQPCLCPGASSADACPEKPSLLRLASGPLAQG